jgi:rare lipoprotein A
MMTKYFAVALFAASTILSGTANPASARVIPVFQAPDDSSGWVGEAGTASYYGRWHQGRMAASGVRFDQRALTAAHPWLPFGTRVKVTLAGSARSVVVTITDRLYSDHRIVDLSTAAARQLGMIDAGLAKVTLLPV